MIAIFDVGKRINKLLASHKIKSLTALAKKAGIAQSSLTYIVSGENSPTIDTIYKICSALGITLPEFFGVEDQELRGLPPDIWDLVKDSNNYDLLRLIIALKAEGISNDLISEMIRSISNTLRIAKKEGVYWSTGKVTKEQKEKAERFEKKIKKSGFKPDGDK